MGFKRTVPVAVTLTNTSGEVPNHFLNATILNRHASANITITFAEGPTGAATAFTLKAGEQFILETVGKPYEAITVDATGSLAVIIYTMA